MNGNISTYAYKTNGMVWGWGGSSYGQLGMNNTLSYSSPVQLIGNHSFMSIDSSLFNSAGLKQDGSMWTWGWNEYGQLGNNNRLSYSSPVQVIGNHSFIQIKSGVAITYGLKENGSAWVWGYNETGAVGQNNRVTYSSPVQVVGNHSFINLKGGGEFPFTVSGGLKADGSLWTWGSNANGQAGTGNYAFYSSPVQVIGNHEFVDFSFGARNMFALKKNGQIWSWGRNENGELGDNSRTERTSPVQVVGNHSFISVIGSYDPNISVLSLTTCAGLKADGSVWTWGYGVGIGNNTTNSYSSPVQVVGNHSFCQLRSMGGPAFIGLKSDGSLWSWGGNLMGQLGDNSRTNRNSPVQVVGNHSFLTLQTGLGLNIKIGSVWKKRPFAFILKSGSWKKVTTPYVNQSSSWKHSALELR
jgi:alpha-tubulin suppressor-like RCC1 family protein